MLCNKCDGKGKYESKLVPFSTGAMGYNLPAAVGFALAKKLKGEDGKVFVVMSDGEMNVGTTWESALIAAHHKLDNLVVIVDRNGLQAMGPTKDTLGTEPLGEKWEAFGWGVIETRGHDYNKLEQDFKLYFPGFPKVIIANTIKGKGISFMEGENVWHYSHVSKETLDKALAELQ